jgi:AraC-like DNA-binding protein
MKHSVHRPPEALREYVELFWTMEADEEPAGLMFKTCATTACAVVFQHHDGRSALQPRVSRDERGQPNDHCDYPTAFARGIVLSPSHTMAIGAFSATGAVFTPQALHRLFKVDAFELTDTPLDLVAFATPNLNERLLNATRQEGRLALFSEFLRVRAESGKPEDAVVAAALRLIRRRVGSIRVPDLLKTLHVSERQLEKRFLRAVGVPPHRYIRLARFEEAWRLAKSDRFEKLSDIAYELNYADQSHFIKEIKAFSGYTPQSLSQLIREAVKDTGIREHTPLGGVARDVHHARGSMTIDRIGAQP